MYDRRRSRRQEHDLEREFQDTPVTVHIERKKLKPLTQTGDTVYAMDGQRELQLVAVSSTGAHTTTAVDKQGFFHMVDVVGEIGACVFTGVLLNSTHNKTRQGYDPIKQLTMPLGQDQEFYRQRSSTSVMRSAIEKAFA